MPHFRSLPYAIRLPVAFMGLMLVAMGAFAVLILENGREEALRLAQEIPIVLSGLAAATLAAAGLLGWLLARSITSPLAELGRSLQAVARHDFDHPIPG